MAVTEVKMKLLIDSNSKRVLFAEVGKECVDFLFYILSLPLVTVIRLLNKKEMVGCIANLYESIENLNQTYLQPEQTKDLLLKPKLPVSSGSNPLLSLPDVGTTQITFYKCSYMCSSGVSDGPDAGCPNCLRAMTSELQYVGQLSESSPKHFYRCSSYNCFNYLSDSPKTRCPNCGIKMTTAATYVTPPNKAKTQSPNEDGGIVKGVVTYMVMDDLQVKPMSTISSIALLNQFNVKQVCALQEKTVTLTMDKALSLLKLSLKSSTVLTNVFLP